MTRLKGIELPFKCETSVGISGDLLDVAGTAINHIDINLSVDSAITTNLSSNSHHIALTINLLVCLHRRREWGDSLHRYLSRGIVGVD